jgi:hypothetical protein
MIPIGIETCWNNVLQYKNILNNNSASVATNFYSINNYARYEWYKVFKMLAKNINNSPTNNLKHSLF